MYDLNAGCELIGFKINSPASCKIGSSTRVDIFLNGEALDHTTEYNLIVTGLNTPNIDSSQLKFTITSYYDSNIYLNRQICSVKFPFPLVTVSPLRNCDLFIDT